MLELQVDIDDGKDVRALKAEVAKDIGVDAKLLTISLTASVCWLGCPDSTGPNLHYFPLPLPSYHA